MLLARAGAGISHGIGVGGRDLSDAVGGVSTLDAIDLLAADAGTDHLILVSKPPGPRTARTVFARLAAAGKPCTAVVFGAGEGGVEAPPAGPVLVPTLKAAVERATGRPIAPDYDAGAAARTRRRDWSRDATRFAASSAGARLRRRHTRCSRRRGSTSPRTPRRPRGPARTTPMLRGTRTIGLPSRGPVRTNPVFRGARRSGFARALRAHRDRLRRRRVHRRPAASDDRPHPPHRKSCARRWPSRKSPSCCSTWSSGWEHMTTLHGRFAMRFWKRTAGGPRSLRRYAEPATILRTTNLKPQCSVTPGWSSHHRTPMPPPSPS